MTHLIDKDKIVAEIDKAIDEPAPSHDQQCPWEDGYYCGLYKAESIIDTLEVKENDLVEELDYDDYMTFFEEHPEYNNGDWGYEETWTFGIFIQINRDNQYYEGREVIAVTKEDKERGHMTMYYARVFDKHSLSNTTEHYDSIESAYNEALKYVLTNLI